MTKATVDNNTRRRDFLALTAAVATTVMAARPAQASQPTLITEQGPPHWVTWNGYVLDAGKRQVEPVSAGSAERVPDPIYAAIEAHKVAAAETNAATSRMSDFEEELQTKGRLRRDNRLEDERRRGEEIETAIEEAHHFEQVAAYALLDVRPTTMAGVIALLNYACDYDDAAYGMGWPENIACEGTLDTRTWQYFLIANVAEILPKLVVTA